MHARPGRNSDAPTAIMNPAVSYYTSILAEFPSLTCGTEYRPTPGTVKKEKGNMQTPISCNVGELCEQETKITLDLPKA
ncbi:MAG: hypothetical protein EOO88_56035 [Pedobacter sp.]|nr:MAG: hypothetical protein EOO88_56035 [Pedobacter sp.]